MQKSEAVERWVARDLQGIPTEWVAIVAGKKGEEHRLPMWGTMFLVDDYVGRELEEHSHTVTHEEDEEMEGELRIADTAAYHYQLDGRYVIGVHGAGWDFYDGVWDVLYDLLGYKWHEETLSHKRQYISGDGDDGWTCNCGNTAMQTGFQPCDKNGYPVEPAPGWEGFYYCDDCGRIIEATTLSVVGTAVPPPF